MASQTGGGIVQAVERLIGQQVAQQLLQHVLSQGQGEQSLVPLLTSAISQAGGTQNDHNMLHSFLSQGGQGPAHEQNRLQSLILQGLTKLAPGQQPMMGGAQTQQQAGSGGGVLGGIVHAAQQAIPGMGGHTQQQQPMGTQAQYQQQPQQGQGQGVLGGIAQAVSGAIGGGHKPMGEQQAGQQGGVNPEQAG